MRQAVRARVELGPGKTTTETLDEREVRTWGGQRGLALPVLAWWLDRRRIQRSGPRLLEDWLWYARDRLIWKRD